jgi:hypothetical protein
VSGAAAAPLAFLWSPSTAYAIFLGFAAIAATLGFVGIRSGTNKT